MASSGLEMKLLDSGTLTALYSEIPVPNEGVEGESIFASAIDDDGHYRIGRDVQGNAVFLISTPSPTQESPRLRSVRLKRLTVQHDLQCMVTDLDEDASTKMPLSVVRCTDETLTDHFLRIVTTLVNWLGAPPSRPRISSAIGRLADLFQALSSPMRGTAQGLWTELFVINQSSDPALLVESWHLDAEDRFDFAHQSQRLEVKSFSGSSRRHHFSLDQLRPVEEVEVIVASVRTVSSSAGPSISDLLLGIQRKLGNPDAALRMEEIAAEILGQSLDEELQRRFDDAVAQETLRFYRAEYIPSVDKDLPRGVYSVRFVSDLDGIPELQSVEGQLFTSAWT